MEDKNIKEAGKVVLTDEELMEIVGGTGDSGGTGDAGHRVAEFCRQFETIEECRSRPFCQWYDFGSRVCVPHPRALALLAHGVTGIPQ